MPSIQRFGTNIDRDFATKCRSLSAGELRLLLDQFDLEKEYNWTLYHVLSELAGKDPAGFFEYASKLAADNPLTKNKVNPVQKAVDADRNAVEKWIKDGGIRNRGTFLLALETLSILYPQDYSKQIDLILQRADRNQQLQDQVHVEAGKYDLGDAMKHARTTLSGPELGRAQISILFGAASQDAEAAYHMAETVDPKAIGNYYGAIFQNWMKQDMTGAIDALGKMPPERVSIVLNPPGRVEAIVERNPSAAIEAASGLVFSESTKPLFTRVAVAVAKRDYDSARDWVEGLPDSPSKNKLLAELEKIPAQSKP